MKVYLIALLILGLAISLFSCKKANQPVSKQTHHALNTGKETFAKSSPLWAKAIDSEQGLYSIKISPDDKMYLFCTKDSLSTDIIKIDMATGAPVWKKTIRSFFYKTIFDSRGNIFMLSQVYTNHLYPNIDTVNYTFFKIDASTGNILTQKTLLGGKVYINQPIIKGMATYPLVQIKGIGIDDADNIYFSGDYYSGYSNGVDNEPDLDPGPGLYKAKGFGAFVLKLNPGGNTVFVKGFEQVIHQNGDTVTGKGGGLKDSLALSNMMVRPDGSMLIFGRSAVNNGEQLVSQLYDSHGNFEGSKAILTFPYNYKTSYMVGNGTGIFISGNTQTGASYYKIDNTGKLIFEANTANNNLFTTSIAVDPAGDVFFTGMLFPNNTYKFEPDNNIYNFSLTGNEEDIFIDKYDPAGNFKGVLRFPGLAYFGAVQCLVSDKYGNLYMGGTFNNPFDFDPTAGANILSPSAPGQPTAFLVKLTQGN